MENCPKCNFKTQPTNNECPKCGIIFSKYIEKQSKKEISNDKPNSDKLLIEVNTNEIEKINHLESYNIEVQSQKWSSYEKKLNTFTLFIVIVSVVLIYILLSIIPVPGII